MRQLVSGCVAAAMVAGISVEDAQQAPRDEQPARALRDEARRLRERGELGEAIVVANRLIAVAPDDAEARQLMRELQSLSSGTAPASSRR